ncbi:hypothetical protein HAX54_011872, partial [Datura stramonium]|nr:hypothetical protein [Datura stramonium]
PHGTSISTGRTLQVSRLPPPVGPPSLLSSHPLPFPSSASDRQWKTRYFVSFGELAAARHRNTSPLSPSLSNNDAEALSPANHWCHKQPEAAAPLLFFSRDRIAHFSGNISSLTA